MRLSNEDGTKIHELARQACRRMRVRQCDEEELVLEFTSLIIERLSRVAQLRCPIEHYVRKSLRPELLKELKRCRRRPDRFRVDLERVLPAVPCSGPREIEDLEERAALHREISRLPSNEHRAIEQALSNENLNRSGKYYWKKGVKTLRCRFKRKGML